MLISNATDVSHLRPETLRELIAWRPPLGVLSIYIAVDPADRGGGWQIATRNGLDRARADSEHLEHDVKTALRKTADRVEHEIESYSEPPRGLVAFVEIAEDRGEERSFVSQLPPAETKVLHGGRPWLGPLVGVLNDGSPMGIAAISSERVRLLEWSFGRATELHDWQLELYLDDWRERKAQRPPDPATSQAVSSSGRDQHDQRMGANRDRFTHDTGALAQPEARKRGWQRLITFGEHRYCDRFAEGLNGACEARFVADADLASQPARLIADRVAAVRPELRREHEQWLVAHIDDSAYAEGRASFGRGETMQALEQGRVEHLVYDGRHNGLEVEQMIELAVPTSAEITPIVTEAAAKLEPHGGIAALLRY